MKIYAVAYLSISQAQSIRYDNEFVVVVIGTMNDGDATPRERCDRLRDPEDVCVELFSIRGHDIRYISVVHGVCPVMLRMLASDRTIDMHANSLSEKWGGI